MNDSVKDFVDNARKAFEPVGKLGPLGTTMFQKTVNLQVEIATDVLNYATNQLEAVSDFESPQQYLDTQRELVSEYTGRAQTHAKAYLATLAEAREAFAGWTEEVTAAAKPVKPAAKKSARPAARTSAKRPAPRKKAAPRSKAA